MTDTLDEGYAAAAARKAAEGDLPRTPATRVLFVVGLLVVGLILATAAAEARQRSTATDAARSQLTDEIEERSASLDGLQEELEILRGDVAVARQEALGVTSGGFLAQRLSQLEVTTGVAPVTGPGLQVTVDDAPEVGEPGEGPRAGEEPSEETEGRVLDYDLQRLVNGLWAAGAEAVEINGQRLTSLTAIRAAGPAILVHYRPLSPPYVVRAVGEPGGLEPAFADSAGGRYIRALSENFGVRVDIGTVEEMRLSGASGLTLRHARATPAGSSSASSAPQKEFP